MIFFHGRLLAVILFLGLIGCSAAKQDGHAKEQSNSAPKTIFTSVSAELLGEKIEVSLGELLSSPKMKLGHSLNLQDQQILGAVANTTLDQASDSDVATWGNPATGKHGTFQVLSTDGYPEEQLVCRNFMHTLLVGKKTEITNGKACRDMWGPKSPWFLHK